MMDVEKFFSRVDQTKIDPLFLAKAKKLIANCIIRGNTYYAISGYRDPAEQDKLFAIGRSGPDAAKPKVTNAQGFKSYHNYGLAIDFCFDASATREGLQPGWEPRSYIVLAEEAEKLGLFSGMKFTNQDCPHIQIPLNAMSLTKLEDLYKKGGLDSVWSEAEKVLTTGNAFKAAWAVSSTAGK
jgi:peptidoglycan L-alanyl-D-glutamate endopeptidase CwlK